MECMNKERNAQNCPCKTECKYHGVCCECLLYHKKSGGKPACLR